MPINSPDPVSSTDAHATSQDRSLHDARSVSPRHAGRVWFPILRAVNVPNTITSLNFLMGLVAIHLSEQGHLFAGIVVASFAAPVDTLDGWTARRLGQQSALGARLDSTADLTSFGIAPAILAAASGVPFLIAATYSLAAAWRILWCEEVGLQQHNGRNCFHGVPSPPAAAFLLSCLLLNQPLLSSGMALLMAVLMIMDIPVRKVGPLNVIAPLSLITALAVRLLLHLG